MATQSPLARFFKPVGLKVESPAREGGSGANERMVEAPKRCAPDATQDQVSKKPRPTSPTMPSTPTPLDKPASPKRSGEAHSPKAQFSTNSPFLREGEARDLRATLQEARRQAPGSLPPFVAECFHHFESGQQYSWPSYLRPENLRDAEGRRPTEQGYNQGTLLVPQNKADLEKGHDTPMLQQFWRLKAAHFDKIALFKVGKFYEVFYYDAFVAARICDLKWMGADKKPHVGFPEMAKHTYAKKLVDAGYKVVVVEQVERVVETSQRQGAGGSGPACVERDACEVYTQGTLVDPEMLGCADARHMAYLHFEETRGGHSFAACLVDTATSQIQLGHLPDGQDRNALRTLLAQMQPSEIVYDVSNLPSDVLQLVKRLPCRPQLSPMRGGPRGLLAARDRLCKYQDAHRGRMSQVENVLSEDSAVVAAAGAMEYLEAALLGPRILPFAVWDQLEVSGCSMNAAKAKPTKMVLDATALASLEILETLEGTKSGSLFHFLDHTSTDFGSRLLKQWVCAPLCDAKELKKRQDAVEFLLEKAPLSKQVSEGLKKLKIDLERAASRIWSYALQSERHAVMYDDTTARRLGHFTEVLEAFGQCIQLLRSSFPERTGLPERLVSITQTGQGGFPDLLPVIQRLRSSVVQVPNPKGPPKCRPQDGADAAYDSLSEKIGVVLAQLEEEIQAVRNKFPGRQFAFVHRLPGYRYEIECEEEAVTASFLRTVDVTQKNKGRVRFHTQMQKQLLEELDKLEDQREDCIFPFLSRLFREFHNHQAAFRLAVRFVAELDALLALAATSRSLAGHTCRAEILEEEVSVLELRSCRHPVAAAKMGNAFVPNDTLVNAEGVPGVLVVTGPNMGGKSTVLRQTCLGVIMAQLGCRVNAASCRLTPVDRIFTRIGSYDTILEGKSTLLTELEETAAILAHGTRRSLAVLDELGRGTSTFDGAAIASAVLEDLTQRVGCLVLFATHYHPVSQEASRHKSKVAPFHMAASVNPSTSEMTFLYRFLPGLCPASHGHNVAKLAGLPAKVLEEAMRQSAEFERGSSAEVEIAKVELLQAADQGDAGLRSLYQMRQIRVR